MDKFLQEKGFKKGIVENNLYIKSEGDNLLVVLVYVDDIILAILMNPLCSVLLTLCKKSLRCP
jgi:hypothetical protein